MTAVVTRWPHQAERLATELTAQGHLCEYAGCLLYTEAPGSAVMAAGVRTGVQAESMAGIDDGPADSIGEAVARYTRCRTHRAHTARTYHP